MNPSQPRPNIYSLCFFFTIRQSYKSGNELNSRGKTVPGMNATENIPLVLRRLSPINMTRVHSETEFAETLKGRNLGTEYCWCCIMFIVQYWDMRFLAIFLRKLWIISTFSKQMKACVWSRQCGKLLVALITVPTYSYLLSNLISVLVNF